MDLPTILEPHRHSLESALAVAVPAIFADDDESVTYRLADQPDAIARVLIRAIHNELLNASIVYLFRERTTSGKDQVKLGHASRAAGRLHFLTEHDFVLEFNWEAWRDLTAEQRVALVDHELCHCTMDDESGNYAMRPHDVEEFGEIVHRWGLWKSDLMQFGPVVRTAMAQTEMFAATEP
jgi:predicted metallopeptidase